MNANALIFGASGSLGSAIVNSLQLKGFNVFTAGESPSLDPGKHLNISYTEPPSPDSFKSIPSLDAVVWAHGLNTNDKITDFDLFTMKQIFNSNVVFIAVSQAALLAAGKLKKGSRLAIVSSIWQLEARAGKLSYSISKSALQGLVKSCALDLADHGILINAVLPGVIDTPMTHQSLSEDQILCITNQTALKRLAEPKDVASAITFFVGPENNSITGQFLVVDGGYIGIKSS